MNENENGQPQQINTFKCLICHHAAANPVVTACGHLFCWSCLYKRINNRPSCPECAQQCETSKVYPIFIDSKRQSSEEGESLDMPIRPSPIYKEKILNSNMIGGGLPTNSINLPNNLAFGQLLAGYAYSPCLAINSFNTLEEPEAIHPEKILYSKLKIFLYAILIAIILFMSLFIFM